MFDTKRIKGDSEVEYECVYDWYDPSTGAHGARGGDFGSVRD